jgi:uroporphyrin-III C-methyltransferase/precorrin-2 dehydrogenase/sirohydrochlorin ferrochelatase
VGRLLVGRARSDERSGGAPDDTGSIARSIARSGAEGVVEDMAPEQRRSLVRVLEPHVNATGFVSLVGAGPGDPELLTLRGLRRLREADLVLNDALVDAELLELAPQAQRFYVGKRAGRHSIEQADIHHLMIRAARRGQRVVRLKAGDPFVLGRGGEEALALEDAGVAYEVVPGVSSALAAPALAGIPVTHRGVATGFAVVSGHAESAYAALLDGIAPGAATIVVLMGLASRAAIAARLVARGWPSTTPAALIHGASRSGAITWIGTLAALGEAAFVTDLPAVIVIGEAVALADRIGAAARSEPARRTV